MSDYGHPLAFGAFLTPGNAEPGRVVGLAMLAEQVGFDLVTFQDHPYQPAFLDTWTLMSFVAARTGTVRLAANVTNLPLRPPAILARSVASLDLLSGGRVELGLGAGAFWEAIEAMGGRGAALRADHPVELAVDPDAAARVDVPDLADDLDRLLQGPHALPRGEPTPAHGLDGLLERAGAQAELDAAAAEQVEARHAAGQDGRRAQRQVRDVRG